MKKDPMSFSLDLFSCKGKVVMITGANTGLGMIYAIALAKAGADLFIPHHSANVSDVRAAVEECGQRVFFLQGDLLIQIGQGSLGVVDVVLRAGFAVFQLQGQDLRGILPLEDEEIHCEGRVQQRPEQGKPVLHVSGRHAYG